MVMVTWVLPGPTPARTSLSVNGLPPETPAM